MSIDLAPLLDQAFFSEELRNASESITRALETYEERTHGGARPFEVCAPASLDEDWVRDRLVHPLIYFCESEGTPLPRCSGVVIMLFVETRLYAISSADVIRWASTILRASVEELQDTYGTHESQTALR